MNKIKTKSKTITCFINLCHQTTHIHKTGRADLKELIGKQTTHHIKQPN